MPSKRGDSEDPEEHDLGFLFKIELDPGGGKGSRLFHFIWLRDNHSSSLAPNYIENSLAPRDGRTWSAIRCVGRAQCTDAGEFLVPPTLAEFDHATSRYFTLEDATHLWRFAAAGSGRGGGGCDVRAADRTAEIADKTVARTADTWSKGRRSSPASAAPKESLHLGPSPKRSHPIPSLRGSLHHSHGKSLPLPRDACQASREGRCSCSCRSRPTATHPPYTPLGCGWQTHHLRARPVASVAIGRASSEGTRPNTRLRMQRRASASREHTPLPVRLLVECHHTW